MLPVVGWTALGLASVAAVAAGLRRYRPARTRPWVLLGAALAALASGDVCHALGLDGPAGVCYFANYVLITLGLVALSRGPAVADRARLIDLLALACAALLVVWVLVVRHAGRLGGVPAADVLGDLLLVGVTVHLVAGAGRAGGAGGRGAAVLLGVGALGLLGSDVAYGLWPGPAAEAGYAVYYLAWGAAALHPSMAALTAPAPAVPRPCRGRWAVLLTVAVATPPAVLLAQALTGPVTDGVVIAAAAGLTLLLAVVRLGDALAAEAGATARERALREAGAALVAAADATAVADAVRAAAVRLTPPGAVTRVWLATDDGRLVAAGLPVGGPDGPPGAGARFARPATPEQAAPGRAAPGQPAPEQAASDRPGPDRPAPEPVAPGQAVLVCPLRLEPLAVARPGGGALVVTGDAAALAAARGPLEVLAGQAALALDRITLTAALGRRDSDRYLRAVVAAPADAALVVDADRHVRYAGPAVRALLGGADPAPLAVLDDLVDPADHDGLRAVLAGTGDGVVRCALRRPDDSRVLVELSLRDLRGDRLVDGWVVTVRELPAAATPPPPEDSGDLPAQANRRNAQRKFRY